MTNQVASTMKNVEIADIEIGERFRKDHGDLSELVEDIKTNGLMHPVAVAYTPDAEKPYLLIAGERRLRAHIAAGFTKIRCNIFKNVSDVQLRSMELHENIKRKDMSYAEECALKKHIHEMQCRIYGVKDSTSPDAEGWTIAKTAEVFNASRTAVGRDIKLAEAIEKYPELELDKCDNKKEAMKKLNNFRVDRARSVIAETVTKQNDARSRQINNLCDAYILRDCIDGMRDMEERMFDFVEIDPPYAIDLPAQQKQYRFGDTYNEINKDHYEDFMRTVLAECYRVMKNNSWLVCWFGPDPWYQTMLDMLRDTGFSVSAIPAIWVKNSGQTRSPHARLANCHEMFFYARKGNPYMNKPGTRNVFHYSTVSDTKRVHPTERPVEMIKDVMNTFVGKGSTVLVPFLGSGNTLIAAHHLELTAVGFDLTKQYRDAYVSRVIAGEGKVK